MSGKISESKTDAMANIQTALDETKIILHNTMESVLKGGDKLCDFIEKSDFLSMLLKAFYWTAKKTNQCCIILCRRAGVGYWHRICPLWLQCTYIIYIYIYIYNTK